MTEVNLKYYVSEPVMEAFYDMRNAQDPKDRLHYLDVVMEGSVETNAILLQKLYSDVISKSNIDFGAIPDSQGVLTKYKEYKLMSESMSRLNTLYEGKPSEELTMMNKLHDMIIACRSDYELGYKFDIEIIKITYCTSVMTLFEMINVCILAYTRSLRDKKGIEFDFKKIKKKDVLIIRGAKSLLKLYETGQWATIMKDIKKNPMGYSSSITVPTTEATGPIINLAAKAINAVAGFPTPIKAIGGVAIAFIGLLLGIRTIIYVFYSSAVKIKDWVKLQKEFIDADLRSEIKDGSATKNSIEKHEKLSARLENIANYIELHILKEDADAKKELAESNHENFNKADFSNPIPMGFGGEITF